jgi:hypothetical protein
MKRINARILPEGIIPTTDICGVYPVAASSWEILGLLNSELAYYLARIYSGQKVLVATVASLPVPAEKDQGWLGQLARAAYNILLASRTGVENSPYFATVLILQSACTIDELPAVQTSHPLAPQFRWPTDPAEGEECPLGAQLFAKVWHEHGRRTDSLRSLAGIAWRRIEAMHNIIADCQAQIDQEVYRLLEVREEDVGLVKLEMELRQKLRPPAESADDEDDATEETGAESATEEDDAGDLRAPN